MEQLSRRAFAQSVATAGLGVALAGGGTAKIAKADEIPAWAPEHWDYQADVVVVGFGGSGAMAAREAIAQGASCVVLEKCSEELAGGSTCACAGYLFGNDELVHRFILNRRAGLISAGAPTLTGDNTCTRIVVNQQGKRIMNEDHYYNHCKGNQAALQFDGGWMNYKGYVNQSMYLVFDSQLMDGGTVGSRDYSMGWNMAKDIYQWSEDNRAELERGWIVEGETLEDLVANLAASTGYEPIDLEGLKTTIDAYNGYCETGVDLDFARGEDPSPECEVGLQSLDVPPYYACQVSPVAILTIGGLEWGESGSTLDWDGNSIPGLYRAGDVGQPGEISSFGLLDCMAVASYTARSVCNAKARDIPGEAAVVMEAPTDEQRIEADITDRGTVA